MLNVLVSVCVCVCVCDRERESTVTLYSKRTLKFTNPETSHNVRSFFS